MPNWGENRVTISGDKDDIREVRRVLQDDNGYGTLTEFSYHALIPMPKELIGTCSPSRVLDTEEEVEQTIKEQMENYPTQYQMMGRPISRATQAELISKYGSDNWYDWCYEHWGVKWATGDDVNMSSDVGYLQYEFDSPWGPPEPVYQALVARFPNVAIEWFYEEPDMGLTGYLPMPPASMTFTEYVKELGLR